MFYAEDILSPMIEIIRQTRKNKRQKSIDSPK